MMRESIPWTGLCAQAKMCQQGPEPLCLQSQGPEKHTRNEIFAGSEVRFCYRRFSAAGPPSATDFRWVWADFSTIRDPVKIPLSAIRLCACLGLAPSIVGICKPWRIVKQLIILLHVVGDRYFCALSNGQWRCMLNSGSGGGPAGSGVYISFVILR